MGRLIDADKLIEYLLTPPWNIGWDDEIEIINNQPTVEAIPKAEMVAMLTEIQLEIGENQIIAPQDTFYDKKLDGQFNRGISKASEIIQQKINSLKEKKND